MRQRRRSQKDVSVDVLWWTVSRLLTLTAEVSRGTPLQVVQSVQDKALAAQGVLRMMYDDDAVGLPDRVELAALRNVADPWRSVARVAEVLLRAQSDVSWLARTMIAPLPEMQWRIFHLAALAQVIEALRDAGAYVRWQHPLLQGEGRGPQFIALLGGIQYDIWFEAAGAHTYYGSSNSIYRSVVAAINKAESQVGADIGVFCRQRRSALLLECKWSNSGTYVARNGYHQAAGYALNVLSDLVEDVHSFIIGPDDVVVGISEGPSLTAAPGLRMGSTRLTDVPRVVRSYLEVPDATRR